MTGYPVSFKQTIILTYGGLRGAIALALSLMVFVDEEFPKRFRELVLFYMVSMITLTVILNGLTIKKVMDLVDFLPCNPHKEQVKLTVKKKLFNESARKAQELKDNRFLTLVDWDTVYRQAGLKDDAEGLLKEEENLAYVYFI